MDTKNGVNGDRANVPSLTVEREKGAEGEVNENPKYLYLVLWL
jgi:hypothetical protein